MNVSWGNVPANSVLPFFFHTFSSAGASVTISNFAVGDILVYKGTSMTQRASTSGLVLLDTDGIDLDGTTGIQGFSVDLSDNADAGFYAVGSFYTVVVGPITVNANTVNFVAGTFRIIAAENTVGFQAVDAAKWNNLATVELPLVPTTAGRKLDVSAGGEAGVDWANVGSPTTANALTGTTIAVTQKVDVDTIKTNPVVNGGTVTFASNTTVANTTGAVGSVTGNVGGNVTGSVGSVVGLTASNLDATVSSRLASASYTAPLDAAGTRTAVGLASANIDTQLAAIDDFVDTEISTLQTTATAIKNKTDNLPAAPAATSDIPTANANADALLDRANGIETGWPLRNVLRILFAGVGGKASGLETTTAVYRAGDDSKDRITATVDADGNRSAVTLDGA